MPKASQFIIGMIIVSAVVAIFGLYMAEMNTNYGVEYDNTSLEAYNRLESLTNTSEKIKNGTNIKEKSGITDIIGGYFTDAYNVLHLTGDSFDTFDAMSNQAIDDANLGKAGEYIRIALSAIIIVIIFLGIIISAILRRDV